MCKTERSPNSRRCAYTGEGNCGNEEKPFDEFPVSRRDVDGNVLSRQPYCKPCQRAYLKAYRIKNRDKLRAQNKAYKALVRSDPVLLQALREYNARKMRERRKDPVAREKERAKKAREWARIKADPEKHKKYLEDYRIDYRLRMERRRGEMPTAGTSPIKKFPERNPSLDPAPFKQWLKERQDEFGSMQEFARHLGMFDKQGKPEGRQLRRMLNENPVYVQRATVENILALDGYRTEMDDLYPREAEVAA